jgi:type I restriction enzyme, S subunit
MRFSVHRLAELTTTITKGTTPTSLGMSFVDQGIGFLRVQNINAGEVVFEENVLHIDEKTHETLKRSQIKSGDVLVSIAGSIGRAAVVPDNAPELNCNQAVAIIRVKEQLFQSYLRYWLESYEAQTQIGGVTVTGTISNLSLSQLGNLQIPLPPSAQQKNIAAILDQAEALRSARRKAIGLLDELARSVFLEMFGNPANSGKKIKSASFSEVTTRITDGTHLTPEFIGSGVPFIFVRNFKNGSIDFQTDKFISEAEYQKLHKRCPVEEGDVLYTTVGATYGQAALVGSFTKFSFQRHVAHLKPDRNKILPKFLSTVMQMPLVKTQADRQVRGAAQPTLNLTELREFVIPLPPIALQQEFADRITAIEALKAQHRQSLATMDTLFNSLQHRAFRGEL